MLSIINEKKITFFLKKIKISISNISILKQIIQKYISNTANQ